MHEEHTGAQYGVKDGDLVKATIVGNAIKGFVNGEEVISVTDDTYTYRRQSGDGVQLRR
jgi:hypothetical protein